MLHAVAAAGGAQKFPPGGLLEHLVVQGKFGHRPLEPAVICFQLLESPGLVDAETTVLAPPAVESLLRDPDARAASTTVPPEAIITSPSPSSLMISSAACFHFGIFHPTFCTES